jgi:hypothetical protein
LARLNNTRTGGNCIVTGCNSAKGRVICGWHWRNAAEKNENKEPDRAMHYLFLKLLNTKSIQKT